MQITLIYIHGQYGSPEEAEHYRPLFPGCEVIGFDYRAQTPWEAESEIVDRFYSLIHPEPEYYKWFCQRVHGLCEADTEDAPVFPYVWEKIAPLIEGLPLVAHNARFDEGCLKAVFRAYRMDYPDYRFFDTLAASRRHFGCSLPNHQLQTVAAACGYDLTHHHHALADAEACAAIALRIL